MTVTELSKPNTVEQHNSRRHKLKMLHEEFFAHSWRYAFFSAFAYWLPNNGFVRTRRLLMRLGGMKIGNSTIIMGLPSLSGGSKAASKMTIGDHCFVNFESVFDLSADIRLENNVYLGHRVMLITSEHDLSNCLQRGGDLSGRPIVVEYGAWIGAGATVLPGITIGHGAVVGAGSVVTKNVAPNTIVAGVPAKVIKEID